MCDVPHFLVGAHRCERIPRPAVSAFHRWGDSHRQNGICKLETRLAMGDWVGSTIERVGGWDKRNLEASCCCRCTCPGAGMEDGLVAFPLGEASTRASGRGVDFVREGWRVREGGGECVLSWGLANFNSSLALSESFTYCLLEASTITRCTGAAINT